MSAMRREAERMSAFVASLPRGLQRAASQKQECSMKPSESTVEIIVRGTERGAEVLHPSLHGPVVVPPGHSMKVSIRLEVFPHEIEGP